MAQKLWIRIVNFFLTATKNSYVLALDMSIYHYEKLKELKDTDVYYMTMFLAYEPVHNLYVAAYNKFRVQEGGQTGDTQLFTEVFAEMGPNVENWETRIKMVYPKGSAAFKALFPRGRKPFMQGKESLRVQAPKQLADAIGTDVALADVKADVLVYYTELKDEFDNKGVSIKATGTDSKAVKAMRKVMCEDMFGNYGDLLKRFKRTPEDVEQFFDVTIVRDHIQNHFTKILTILKIYVITQRKLLPDVMIKFSNPGTTIIRFYRSDDKTALPTLIFIEVLPGETLTRANSLLGEGKYIICHNMDAVNKGDMDIVFP